MFHVHRRKNDEFYLAFGIDHVYSLHIQKFICRNNIFFSYLKLGFCFLFSYDYALL